MTDPKPKANKYTGGNPTIDRLLAEHWPDDTIWFVNGSKGRKPITAETEQEARDIYDKRYLNPSDDEEDLLLQPA